MRILLAHDHYQQAGGEDVVFETERRFLLEAGHAFMEPRRLWRRYLIGGPRFVFGVSLELLGVRQGDSGGSHRTPDGRA
jgi:hypothetical protein